MGTKIGVSYRISVVSLRNVKNGVKREKSRIKIWRFEKLCVPLHCN